MTRNSRWSVRILLVAAAVVVLFAAVRFNLTDATGPTIDTVGITRVEAKSPPVDIVNRASNEQAHPPLAEVRPARAQDETGAPLSGEASGEAAEAAHPAQFLVCFEGADGVSSTVSPNAKGEFFPPRDLPSGRYRLTAFSTRGPMVYLDGGSEVLPEGVLGKTVVFVQASSSCEVSVACHDTRGSPVESDVRISRMFSNNRKVTLARIKTRLSDGLGVVRIPGAVRLEVAVESIATRAVRPRQGPTQIFDVIPDQRLRVEFTFQVPARVEVHAVDSGDRAVVGALVGLRYLDGGEVRASPKSGRTDSEGAFVFEGLEPGPATFLVTCRGVRPAIERTWISEGESRVVTVRLERGGGSVRGRVVSIPDGAAARMSIFLNVIPTRPEEGFSIWGAKVEEDGSFDIGGLSAGDYELNVMLGGGEHYVLMVSSAEGETDLGELDLGPAKAVGTQSVVVRVNTSVQGHRVFRGLLRHEGWRSGLWAVSEFSTDERKLDGLSEGVYAFRFSRTVNDMSRFDLSHSRELKLGGGESVRSVVLEAPARQ